MCYRLWNVFQITVFLIIIVFPLLLIVREEHQEQVTRENVQEHFLPKNQQTMSHLFLKLLS